MKLGISLILSALLTGFGLAITEGPTSCITLSPLTITLKVGQSTQATAEAYDELGNIIPDAKIQWMPHPDDPAEHCVSVAGGMIKGKLIGSCGVGAWTVTSAGKLILHQTPININVVEDTPSPSPVPSPCTNKRKCRRGCIC